jgi:hypothetical protein
MRNANWVVLVSCGVAFAAACSSSSSNGGSPDAATVDDAGSDSGSASSSSGGSTSDDSGSLGDIGFPMMMVTVTCQSAADCTDGGAGQVCCFSLTSFATSCVASHCATGDYQQCASSDSECPAGYHCIVSPLGMSLHYCAAGDAGGGQADTGVSDGAAE